MHTGQKSELKIRQQDVVEKVGLATRSEGSPLMGMMRSFEQVA